MGSQEHWADDGPRGHHPAYAPGIPACALYEDGGRGMPHHPLRRPRVSNQWCSSRTNQATTLVFYRLNSDIETGTKPDALGCKLCHGIVKLMKNRSQTPSP